MAISATYDEAPQVDHGAQLRKAVVAATIGTTIEWYDFFLYGTAAGLIFGIVADMDEISEDPQILASEALVPFADGSSLTVNSPIWIRGQEKAKPRPAPTVGEHSEEVLRAAGFEETEIRALREEGVIA